MTNSKFNSQIGNKNKKLNFNGKHLNKIKGFNDAVEKHDSELSFSNDLGTTKKIHKEQ